MNSTTIPYKQIPGPGFFTFVRNVRANPVLYFYELMKQFGDVVRCRSVQDIYLISNPVLAREVFLNSQKLFDKKNFINNRLRKVMGDGLILTTGEKWRKQRKAVEIIYKKEELQKCVPEILRHTDSMLQDWKSKADGRQPLNINWFTRILVMQIMADCLLSEDDPEVLRQLSESFFAGSRYISNPSIFNLPGWVPMSRKSKLNKAMNKLDNIILDMMAEWYDDPDKYEGKLLAYIMDQRDESGNPLSREEILAEIKNVFGASIFATSDVLTWLIYSLAQYPGWADKIFNDCETFIKTRDPDSLEQAFNMQLFIHEVLRCYPAGWASSHRSTLPIRLDKYEIPRNATVMVSIYNLHHHPGFWDEPETFNPYRFDPSNKLSEKAMYVPFGLGPRKCLGMGLARLIINIVCAKIVSHFHLKVNEEVIPIIQSGVSLTAKNDPEIFIEPR